MGNSRQAKHFGTIMAEDHDGRAMQHCVVAMAASRGTVRTNRPLIVTYSPERGHAGWFGTKRLEGTSPISE